MRRFLRWLSYLLGIGILLGMGAFLFSRDELLESLGAISAGSLVILLLLALAASMANGAQFNEVAKIFGLRLGFSEWYGLSVTNTMLNYAIPLRGGTLMRAAYMKQRYGLSFTAFASLTASSQLITIAIASFFGLSLIVAVWAQTPVFHTEIAVVLAVGLVGTVVAYLLVETVDFRRIRPPVLARNLGIFADGFAGWRMVPAASLRFSIVGLLWMFLQGLRLWASFRAVGVDVGLIPVLLIQAVLVISIVISVTPGDLGVREGLTALAALLIGLDPSQALLASLVDRASALVVNVGFGVLFSQTLLRGMVGRDKDLPVTED